MYLVHHGVIDIQTNSHGVEHWHKLLRTSTVDPEKEVRSGPLGTYPKRRFALKEGSIQKAWNVVNKYFGIQRASNPFSMLWNIGNLYTCDFNFLEIAHTNLFSSIRITYRTSIWVEKQEHDVQTILFSFSKIVFSFILVLPYLPFQIY